MMGIADGQQGCLELRHDHHEDVVEVDGICMGKRRVAAEDVWTVLATGGARACRVGPARGRPGWSPWAVGVACRQTRDGCVHGPSSTATCCNYFLGFGLATCFLQIRWEQMIWEVDEAESIDGDRFVLVFWVRHARSPHGVGDQE